MEPPKKKRRLLIVDVSDEGTPIVGVGQKPESNDLPVVGDLSNLGHAHGHLQKYVVRLSNHYQYDVEDIDERMWKKVDAVLSAKTVEEANSLIKEAGSSAQLFMLSMWSKKKAAGPATPENYEKQAKSAESLSKMFSNKGDDEKAKEQAKKAAQLRAEAKKVRTK